MEKAFSYGIDSFGIRWRVHHSLKNPAKHKFERIQISGRRVGGWRKWEHGQKTGISLQIQISDGSIGNA